MKILTLKTQILVLTIKILTFNDENLDIRNQI